MNVSNFLFIGNGHTADYLNFHYNIRQCNNPFSGTAVWDPDFVKLIDNYDKLDLDGRTIVPAEKAEVLKRGYTWDGTNRRHNVNSSKTFAIQYNMRGTCEKREFFYRHTEYTPSNIDWLNKKIEAYKKSDIRPFFIYRMTQPMIDVTSAQERAAFLRDFLNTKYEYKLYISPEKNLCETAADNKYVICTDKVNEQLARLVDQRILKNWPDDFYERLGENAGNNLCDTEKPRHLTTGDLCKYAFAISVNDEQYDTFNQVMRHYGFSGITKYEGFRFHHISISTKKCLRLELTNDAIAVPNCSYSHAAVIKMAKYLDWPYVCIFEDDAYPIKEIKEKIDYYLTGVPANIKLLLLGHTELHTNGKQLDNKKYVGVYKACGSHAYILFKNGYDAYLDLLSSSNCIADLMFGYMPDCYSTDEILFTQCNFTESAISGKNGLWHKQIGQPELQRLFENPSFFKKPRKKLILIGNKDIQTDISDKINKFDFVVRLNHANNFKNTGNRTDLLLADPHGEFLDTCDGDMSRFNTAKRLLITTTKCASDNRQTCIDRGIFTESQYDNAHTFNLREYADRLIPNGDNDRAFPTNFFIMLNWCVEHYSDEYEIWITCVDIDGRGELFRTNPIWSSTWHVNAGKIEEQRIKDFIQRGIVHELKI